MNTYTIFFLMLSLINCSRPDSQFPTLEDSALGEYMKNEDHKPVLSGTIIGSPEAYESLKVKVHVVQAGPKTQITYSIEIQPDGTFIFHLNKAFPYQQIWFSFDELFYCELLLHDSLNIVLDLKKLKNNQDYYVNPGVKYVGPDAELNRYINTWNKFKKPERDAISSEIFKIVTDRKKDSSEKIATLDSLNDSLLAIENEFIRNNPSDYSEFLTKERLSDHFAYQSIVRVNGNTDYEFIEKASTHQPIAVSNGSSAYYRHLSFLVMNGSPSRHQDAMLALLKKLGNEKNEFLLMHRQFKRYIDGDDSLSDTIKEIRKELWADYQEEILEWKWYAGLEDFNYLDPVKFDLLKLYGGPEDQDSRSHYHEVMLPTYQTEWIKSIAQVKSDEVKMNVEEVNNILKRAKKVIDEVSIGNHILSINEDINLFEVKNNTVPELINSLHKYYPNKAIILDLWATWCKPCIEDMNQSKQVKSEIQDLPLAVVYLCTSQGSTLEKWQRKVAEIGAKGDHLYLDKALSAEIMDFFQISGYPSFIYLDSAGVYHPNLIRHLSIMGSQKIKEIVEQYH